MIDFSVGVMFPDYVLTILKRKNIILYHVIFINIKLQIISVLSNVYYLC